MSRRDAEFAAFLLRQAMTEARNVDCGHAAAGILADALVMAFEGCDLREIADAVAVALLPAVCPDFFAKGGDK